VTDKAVNNKDVGLDVAGAPNTTAKTLMNIWSQILAIEHIAMNDNFVELGGDSISATLLVNRVREVFGTELPFASLFGDNATVAELAGVIDQSLKKSMQVNGGVRPLSRL
jgi:acyl carrier protein